MLIIKINNDILVVVRYINEEIVALYEFDADLRELVFRYLMQIERHARSLISYYFTEIHGESQSEYLDPNNYTFIFDHIKLFPFTISNPFTTRIARQMMPA